MAFPPTSIRPPGRTRQAAGRGDGGAKALNRQARKAFDAGDYRWAADLASSGVFADPANAAARDILADSYEQLGYQSESAVWRNIYLSGARKLRQRHADKLTDHGPNFLMLATPFGYFLDLVATTLVPEKAADAKLAFNLVDAASGERFTVTLENQVLVHEDGETIAGAPTLTAPRPILLGVLFGQAPLDAMVASGRAKLDGDGAAIRRLSGMLQHNRPSISTSSNPDRARRTRAVYPPPHAP